jgi:splicing factor 3A subunit 1
VLKAAGDRYLWDKFQEEESKKNEGQKPVAEPMQVDSQIDWHDFIVVE